MNHDQVKCVVQIVLAIMAKVARKTSTPADDLMVSVLESNQDRIADVALRLVPKEGCQLPTDAQIATALHAAGIKV
jgi:hypothetical protein